MPSDLTPKKKSPATDRHELSQYDRKVHRACTAMVAATTAELARLDVPFFNTRPDLVLTAQSSDCGAALRNPHPERGSEGRLDEAELRELQAKMLVLLEDLCSE